MQAAHELSDKRQLYTHLLRAPDGTYSGALKDAYPTVADDIAALRSECLIWLLPSVDVGGDEVLYPREERPMISVSPDVAALWHEVTVCSRPHTVVTSCLHYECMQFALAEAAASRHPELPRTLGYPEDYDNQARILLALCGACSTKRRGEASQDRARDRGDKLNALQVTKDRP